MLPLAMMALLVVALAVACTLSFVIGKDKGREDARVRAWLNQQYGVESVPPLSPSPAVRAAPQPLHQVEPGK